MATTVVLGRTLGVGRIILGPVEASGRVRLARLTLDTAAWTLPGGKVTAELQASSDVGVSWDTLGRADYVSGAWIDDRTHLPGTALVLECARPDLDRPTIQMRAVLDVEGTAVVSTGGSLVLL